MQTKSMFISSGQGTALSDIDKTNVDIVPINIQNSNKALYKPEASNRDKPRMIDDLLIERIRASNTSIATLETINVFGSKLNTVKKC